jgi:hypothetical protein
MKKLIASSLLILSLVSCGKNENHNTINKSYQNDKHFIDNELSIDYHKAVSDIGQPIHNKATLRYMTNQEQLDNPDKLGVCFYNKRTVVIFKSKWDKLNQWERWILIAHELGHCAYGVTIHNDNGMHVMNTKSFPVQSEETYKKLINTFSTDLRK